MQTHDLGDCNEAVAVNADAHTMHKSASNTRASACAPNIDVHKMRAAHNPAQQLHPSVILSSWKAPQHFQVPDASPTHRNI